MSKAPTWQLLARRVGPSEKQRTENIEKLKALPSLDSLLIQALDTNDRALSLDVIGALRLEHLTPELKKRVEEDNTGFLILTLNSLISKKTEPEIIGYYLELLKNPDKLTPAGLVALLEPMNRLRNVTINLDAIKTLSTHSSPEVRSEVLNILRSQLLQKRLELEETNELMLVFLKDPTYSLRLQTYSLIQEFDGEDLSNASPLLEVAEKRCKKETSSEALFTCHSIFSLPYGQRPTPLLSASDTYDIYVVFGYKDARPSRFVGDRHERLAFIQKIISSCQSQDDNACGFTRSPKYSDVFYRTLKSRGDVKKIRMLVVQSSASTDDENNRTNPFQKIQSDYARRVFNEGLRRGHVVFYNGHSRFGGGPDFNPPKLDSNGEIHLSYYKRKNLGLKEMMTALKASSNSPTLNTLGLFSCSSTQHFHDALKTLTPARLLTDQEALHYSEALENSLRELSNVLSDSSLAKL